MGWTKYMSLAGPTTIEIQDNDFLYYTKVCDALNILGKRSLGENLFRDITATGMKVCIVPAPGGNQCDSLGNAAVYYTLRAALRSGNAVWARQELTQALNRAAGNWTPKTIAMALVEGQSPASPRSADNVRITVSKTGAERNIKAAQIELKVSCFVDGTKGAEVLRHTKARGDYSLADDLIRFLRPWLQPGTGGPSRISFDPDNWFPVAYGNEVATRRPPHIGLAHELCHAWRNAVGKRLFEDAKAVDQYDDELMTVGLPPYEYEPYSENLFRLASGEPLRLNYHAS